MSATSMENDIKTPILRRFLHQNMDFDSVGSMPVTILITCSKRETHPQRCVFFWEDQTVTDESRGWSRFAGVKRFASRGLDKGLFNGKVDN